MDVVGVGYEGRDADAVISGLRADGIRTVVDVRLTPLSRKRGLSKRALAAALAEAGIEYLHLPALGNPRDNRGGFADPTSPGGRAAHDRYRRILAGPEAQDALGVIRERAGSGRVALLCVEADGSRCHRSLVLDALGASGER